MSDVSDLFDRAYLGTFLVEIDGVEIGRFSEVTGLSVDVEVEDYVEGGENGFVHKFPGRMTWPNLVFKRGITKEDVFMKWLHDSVGDGAAKRNGKATRTTAAITMMSPDGKRLRKWNVVDAFPIRWTGPDFAVTSTEAAVEELEIAHHGFRSG